MPGEDMENSKTEIATGCVVLPDGSAYYGIGFGATGWSVGELCFNTAMTGYQEIMTDPSYAGQAVVFTFPHIGNTGANSEDNEAERPSAIGMIMKWTPSEQSSWRAEEKFSKWLSRRNQIGIGAVDTRRLTRFVRTQGAQHAALAHEPDGKFDIPELARQAREFPGLDGLDLAKDASVLQQYQWSEPRWRWPGGKPERVKARYRVAAVDYGAKENILRCLASVGCEVTVFPAQTDWETILASSPDGLFLSNGPGDPAATAEYAVPMIRGILENSQIPIFGICLGHQLLALALGAKTAKMKFGHHGANHPVKDAETGKVEITSMNHGFTVAKETLPPGVVETHFSLFDGTNCGIRMLDRPVFSVQFHPEASPGPQDSFYLFENFARAMEKGAGNG